MVTEGRRNVTSRSFGIPTSVRERQGGEGTSASFLWLFNHTPCPLLPEQPHEAHSLGLALRNSHKGHDLPSVYSFPPFGANLMCRLCSHH